MRTLLLLVTLFSLNVYAGSYTPTITALENIHSVSAHKAVYSVDDDVINVSGAVTIAPTDDAVIEGVAKLAISLPVSSALGSEYDCAGVVGEGPNYNVGDIYADAANDRAELYINPTIGSSDGSMTIKVRYKFSCELIL